MFHFIFRISGLFFLALAVVLMVLDLTRSISASEFVLTPAIQTWQSLSPQTLEASKTAIENWILPFAWDPMLLFILKLPTWAIMWVVAMLLLLFGQKRESPYGRFSDR